MEEVELADFEKRLTDIRLRFGQAPNGGLLTRQDGEPIQFFVQWKEPPRGKWRLLEPIAIQLITVSKGFLLFFSKGFID